MTPVKSAGRATNGHVPELFEIGRAAVRLAEGGFCVFPCWPVHDDGTCACALGAACEHPGKHPVEVLAPRGFKNATRDLARIGEWWDGADLNIGIACGESGIVVLDIDPKHGADPDALIAELGIAGYPIVRTGVAPAPSDEHPNSLEGVRGAHTYFQGALSTTNKTGRPGVEFKAIGGYVIGPFSEHASGVIYEGVLPPVAELPEVPAAVLELHAQGKRAPAAAANPDSEVIGEGMRHTTLLSQLGALRRSGASESILLAHARVFADECCDPPLPAEEAERAARDAAEWTAGQATLPATRSKVPVEPVEEVDLTPRLDAYPAFPLDALPGPARALAEYGSASAGLPIPLLAGAALGAAAGAIGGNAEVVISGSWRERAILWTALLGHPGAGKSPAMELAFAPLRRWDAEQHERMEAQRRLAEEEDGKRQPPPDFRVRIDDATIESVRDLLDVRKGAAVLDADELSAFLSGLGQYKRGKGSDRDRTLSLWAGHPWSANRSGGTDVLISRPTLAICGGLQIERHGLLGPDGDGSRVRWLAFLTPDMAGGGDLSGEPPTAWRSTLRALLERRATTRTWQLDAKARGAFMDRKADYQTRMRVVDRTTEAGALAKAPINLARVALVLAELADPAAQSSTKIGAGVVLAAAEIVEFTLACWRALPDQDEMERTFADRDLNPRILKLITWLERRGAATKRELRRAKVAGCRTPADLDALLALYEASYPGVIERDVIPPGGGTPTTIVKAPGRKP